jgi:ABC-type uncharacterized transport system substrate-binding protein
MPRALAYALLLFSLWPGIAIAHPHVWADMRSQLLVGDDGLITGARVEWTTDKAYARDALEIFKKLPDGNYSPEDLAKLTQENLSALADYGFFINFRFDGEKQKIGKAEEGLQTYNPATGRLTLYFSVPLLTPLDPAKGKVALKVYDPEFFIDFEYVAQKPLLISKPLANGCVAKLLPIPSDSSIDQTKAMLATKGRDWKPENDEDFGAMFAQAAEVTCTP